MRFVSFLSKGKEDWGLVVGDGVAPLSGRTGHATLAEFIASPATIEPRCSNAGLPRKSARVAQPVRAASETTPSPTTAPQVSRPS